MKQKKKKEIYLLSELQNVLKEFNPDYFVLKTKAKEIENSSSDYQTREIICSMAFESNQGILHLIILF